MTLELYKHQKEAIDALVNGGKKFLISGTGSGKGAVMLHWLKSTGKKKWLIVTTASKRDEQSIPQECDDWFGSDVRESLSSFSVVSWAGLRGSKSKPSWFAEHRKELDEWAIAFDEVHNAKAGISSAQGKAFLQITMHTDCWTGYTATPAQDWVGYYPYFCACGHVRNKGEFMQKFVLVQTYKGFPEVVGYRDTDTLKDWWADDSFAPDTTELMKSLPPETHQQIHFKKPTGYDKVDKTGYDLDGNFIETNSGLRHYLRKMCATKQKLDWIKDFIQGLQTNCLIFYTYVDEGDSLEKCVKQALDSFGKCVKVWRIDGKHHDIPSPDTIGKHDVVLAQWQSGSASINLQFIDYWVSCTPHDSYVTSLQARGRVQRIGAVNPKFFYYLRCDGTEEDNIYENLKERKEFSQKAWVIKRNEEGRYLPEPIDKTEEV